MHLCLATRLLPEGENLNTAQEYLVILNEGQDPSVMKFFVEKAIGYIDSCRGLAQ
jgi:hypothetical protein